MPVVPEHAPHKTGNCSGTTGWRLMARFCTVRSFIPASNTGGKAWQGRCFRVLALLKIDDDMHSKKTKAKTKTMLLLGNIC